MEAEVFIGEVSVKLPESQKMSLSENFRLSDISNIKSRSASSTKSLTLPASVELQNIFGFPEDATAIGSFNNDSKLRGRIEVGGSVEIEGNVKLKNTKRSGKGNLVSYVINIVADNTDWKLSMNDKNINDQDWSEYDHDFSFFQTLASEKIDSSPIQQLFGQQVVYNIADEFLVYAPINYGKFSGNIEEKQLAVEDLRPHLNVRKLFLRSFNDLGFKVVSKFLDSPFFRGQYIAFTRETLRNSSDFREQNEFQIGADVEAFYETFYDTQNNVEQRNTGVNAPFGEYLLFTDRVGFTNEAAPNFDTPNAFTPAGITRQVSGNIENITQIPGSEYIVPVSSRQKLTANIQGKLELGFQVITSFTKKRVTGIRLNLSIKVNGLKVASLDNTVTNPIPAEINVVEVNEFNTSVETPEIDLVANDVVTVEMECYLLEAAGSVAQGIIVSELPAKITIFDTIVLRNEVMDNVVVDGRVSVNDNLPDIEQLEFNKAFMHLYELYYLTDVKNRIVYIEPRSEFYTGKTQDWRRLIDTSEDMVIEGLGFGENKQIRWRYKEDASDFAIKEREEILGDILAAHLGNVDNIFAKEGIDENENPVFAPTVMDIEPAQLGLHTTKIPKMWQEMKEDELDAPEFKTDWVNRLLYYNGIVDLQPGEEYLYTANSTPFGLRRPRTDIALMHSVDESQVNDNSLYFDTRNRSHGLQEKYHKGTLRTINDGKLIKARAVLTPKQIEALDFRQKILILVEGEATLCILNAVKNRNSLSTKSTQVELITVQDDVVLTVLANKDDPQTVRTVRGRTRRTGLLTNDNGTIVNVYVTLANGSVEKVF